MRTSISSTEKVKPDTDLYNKLLPPNAGGINDVSIEIDEKGISMVQTATKWMHLLLVVQTFH